MAANTVTSTTGTVSGSDPSFVVTYKAGSDQGIVLYVKYTQGTEAHITLTFDTLNASLHASDKYRMTSVSGTMLTAYTMVITLSGNYRIPLPIIASEKTICVNIAFSSAAQGGAAVANFMES